ncbi:shikimate dehydrogenase [Sphingopyxis sp. FD7]|jgi:shikimate dehydrogenase|uniref:shikimate dehydrogenase n=1 Tax=Sphingopyxis sp. FD7 TaxID=1914525 RepID=UPI000DC625F7|nr:shikimate dehydrogenase [Sphingopyxis sp. FD7]BBB13843.1 shikimate 5-dehydrogenase [Sphingopyxis sp. FD7]
MSKPYAEVIGDPIAQSKSPLIHNFWLDALGIAGDYRRFHVPVDALADYIAGARADADWRGCNVTMPHKQAIMDLVDDPGDIRGTIGAMNTVVRQPDGSVIGTNTDAAGFYAPLAELDLEGAPVAVVGAGGAARAVLFALARAKVGPVTILNRSPLKAMGLLATFGLKGEVAGLDAQLPPVSLLVNSSSLGMTGNPPLDLDLSPLPGDAIVYDLVYSPLRTGLLNAAEARGLATVDGLDMLIGQAALAFELFFGAPPPEGRDDELRALLVA